MSIFPQPCLAPPESPKLRAKQNHAKSAKRDRFSASSFLKFQIPHFAFPNQITPSRPASAPRTRVGAWRPLRAKARPGNAGREQSVSQSPITNLPFRPWRPWREQSAFSLTEVVIAMGVAAVAFTSIIALFPLGLSMSKESFETTQAAFITQSIMNQITDAQGGNTLTGFRRIIITADNDPTKGNLKIDVGNYLPSTNVYIAYANYVGTNGEVFWKPASTITAADWNSGKSNSPALVRVTLNRIFTGGKSYDIHGVEVQVDYPGSLALTNLARKHEIFSRICH
jgi:type II secretory pathway pseudopilin PulG